MNWKQRAATSIVGLFVLFIGGQRDAYAAPPADPCSLLPASQIQKTVGQPFSDPSENKVPPAFGKQPWGTHCDYRAVKGPNVHVIFIVYEDSSAAEAKQTFEKLAIWFAPKSKPAGIGDSAYVDRKNAIHVVKGKVRYYIELDPVGEFTPTNEKQVKDLAVAVAGRI